VPQADQPRPFHYQTQQLWSDGVRLSSLAAKFGTPLYVYSASAIRERLGLVRTAFAARAATICYAVKANSNLALLKMLAAEGAGFDIVSGGELERVRRAAPQALSRTVFSGVGKTEPEMLAAIRAGVLLFNVESGAELDLLAALAQRLKRKVSIALRINPDIQAPTHPYISTGLREHKFGIPMRDARRLYRRAAAARFLAPIGISVHIGSQILDPKPFGQAVERVVALARRLASDGVAIRYIDAGGGLGIDYAHATPAENARRIAAYAHAINRAIGDLPVHLLLEPGRFLVAQSGALLTRVLYVKRNGRKKFVITDAGMTELIRPALYSAEHEIIPVRQSSARKEKVDVVGPVCETGDFLARDRMLASAKSGELLAILDAGAYGMALASNYNSRLRPAEVLVEAGKARLIRRRESLDDLLATEQTSRPRSSAKPVRK
jgi:diaminopimelate decarboxylase